MFRAPEGLTCRAGLLCAPVGGGPPARRPRRELCSARRLEARPGPATAAWPSCALRPLRRPPRWRGLGLLLGNFACNSPMAVSNSEFRSLELQRFETLLNVHPIELRASFLRSGHIGTCWCLSRCPQTGVAFAGAGRAVTETGVASAGEKKLFLARFSGAEVSSVSRVPVQGRALVMVVSQLPRGCVLCAKKFALRGLMWG